MGIINISGLATEESVLYIYNLTGVMVKSQTVNSNHSQVNIASLEQGIYVVRFGKTSERIVLIK